MDRFAVSPDLSNIIASRILSKLTVQDLQAFGRCFTGCRRLIYVELPSSTWRAVVTNSFPFGHPLFQTEDASICASLNQLAAARAAIKFSKLSAEASISLNPPGRASILVNSPAVASHAGTQLIALQGGRFRLWDLDLGSRTVHQRWSKPASDLLPTVVLQGAECKFVWSSDDALVALAFTPWIPDPEDSCSERIVSPDFGTSGWRGMTTYVLQLDDLALHKVAEGTAWSTAQAVQFIPTSNMLICPWDNLQDGQCHVDVYSPHDWKHVGNFSHPDSGLDARLAFSPDGQLIADGHINHVSVYGVDGKLRYRVKTGSNNQRKHWHVAWSPQGDKILLWQGSTAPAKLYSFDCTSRTLNAQHSVQALKDPTPGMPRVLTLVSSFSTVLTVHNREFFIPGFLADVQLTKLSNGSAPQQLVKFQSLAMPAFSPDGAFLSFVGPVKGEAGRTLPAVYIVDCTSGQVRQKIKHADWQGLDVVAQLARPFFSLTWAACGTFVLVRTFVSNGAALNKEWLTVIRFAA